MLKQVFCIESANVEGMAALGLEKKAFLDAVFESCVCLFLVW